MFFIKNLLGVLLLGAFLLLFQSKDGLCLVMVLLLPVVWGVLPAAMKKGEGGGLFLLLGGGVLGFYLAPSLLLFFLMFEFVMYPMLFIIAGWGYQFERFQATNYFLVYAFFCSLPFFFFLLAWLSSGGASLLGGSSPLSTPLPLLILAPFLAKLPLFFLHFWLPKAHVEAPTTGSMVLAGILLKMGGYGILRLVSFFVGVSFEKLLVVGGVGFLFSAILCVFQSDSKALVAYSSVAHMNFMVVGALIFMSGSGGASLLVMLSHGFISSALFFTAGWLFQVFLSRTLYFLSKSGAVLCSSGVFVSLLLFANFGVPPFLSSFSEVLLFLFLFSKGGLLGPLAFFYCMAICYASLYFFFSLFHGKEGGMEGVEESGKDLFCFGALLVATSNFVFLSLL